MTPLNDRTAIVYGAGGAMGGAVSRALASAGARTFLAGRTLDNVKAVVAEITDAGGQADAAQVNARDAESIRQHVAQVVEAAGHVDILFNAVGMDVVQNVALVDMSLDDFMLPIVESAQAQFLTATAVAQQMIAQRSGVIVTLSSTAAREWRHQMGGFSVACAGVETFTRALAHELGPFGVRVVCVRPNFTPETSPTPIPDDLLEPLVRDTALGRLPRLSEVADAVVFAASAGAGAISGTVLNLSCGAIVD